MKLPHTSVCFYDRLTAALTKIGMDLKDCYKATMHVDSSKSAEYKEVLI